MRSLIEQYNAIFKKLKVVYDRIGVAETSIENIRTTREGDIPARIENLEEQLKKIDEYMLKIEAFRKLAEKNLESLNVLTIEAPPGYRVNLNRLRSWAMMIDPMSPNDPYAQRVYVVAKCDEHFLLEKKHEFSERIAALKNDESVGCSVEIERLEREITRLKEEIRAFAGSDELAAFASDVEAANRCYWYETAPEAYSNSKAPPVAVAPGAYAAQLDFGGEQKQLLKNLLGKFYDADSARVLLPVELDTKREFALSVTCTPARTKQLDRGLQNFILNIVNGSPAGFNKVHVIDAVRFNSAVLGSLKQLEDTFAVAPIPRNPEQLTAALEQIVSSFADMDDMLELCDSVIEYNEKAAAGKQLPRTTLILVGWPAAFDNRDREYVQRIMTNYERYGVSFVTVAYANDRKEKADESGLTQYAAYNAVHINMFTNETTIRLGNEAPQRFTWYAFTGELPESYAITLRSNAVEKLTMGNEYTKRYDCDEVPVYTRTYKKVELPFGIDGKDVAHSVSFENENFAAYLVGASRSGKSTLIHTLIAGLIRNYHPDNLELWLADFKQLEFKKYIEHCPPHVKYVLLDESTELVYDLIDKLTDKMMERQRLFARLGKERIDQLNPAELSKPMPVIFVILDEFSIMSQAIAESQTYRLRLQNLLAKGAALGIKFLFSSQTFTTGVAGLTPTARAQIQQRIAMKGTREEISETLELSPNLKTEQVRNWMDALPPHYALVKYRISADTLPQVKRVLVMYFKDYAPRDAFIARLNAGIKAIDRYTPNDINTYVDKHPVLVDGNSYEAFSAHKLLGHIASVRIENISEPTGGEMFLAFGTPRLMSRIKLVALTAETRENVLLIGGSSEQPCCASVVSSAIRSALLQGKRISIWAYEKNRLYRAYKKMPWGGEPYGGLEFVQGIDAVCAAIHDLKRRILEKQGGDDLIIMIGMERICGDFEYVDGAVSSPMSLLNSEKLSSPDEFAISDAALVQTEEQNQVYAKAMELNRSLDEICSEIEERGVENGNTLQEIQQELERVIKAYMNTEGEAPEEFMHQAKAEASRSAEEPVARTMQNEKSKTGAYNASADFNFILRQGSRLGYHFMLCLDSLVDLKLTGLKADYFRHRLSFQIPADESRELFSSTIASGLPEHICQYSNMLDQHSFRPYLHSGVVWDGWDVDEVGNAVNPF